MESILEDDITTHICACAGGAVAGILTVLTFLIMPFPSYATSGNSNPLDDEVRVLVNLLLSFYLSYCLLFTVMEPLRAAIKAFYVSFAQHPQSLAQAFPLIYHRLSRLADSSEASSAAMPMSPSARVEHPIV